MGFERLPYSKAQCKTVKHHPGFPGRLGSKRRASAGSSSSGTITQHRHGGISLLTPSGSSLAAHPGRSSTDGRPRTRPTYAALTRPLRPAGAPIGDGSSRSMSGSTAHSASTPPMEQRRPKKEGRVHQTDSESVPKSLAGAALRIGHCICS